MSFLSKVNLWMYQGRNCLRSVSTKLLSVIDSIKYSISNPIGKDLRAYLCGKLILIAKLTCSLVLQDYLQYLDSGYCKDYWTC